jgi:metal-responsive CopG/Arc/MetJ family transcriptional regulator
MKAIQITVDERLLAKLDGDSEVKREGRSAVIRRALTEYLSKKQRSEIATAYQRGYKKYPATADFAGWTDEGVWPDE